MRALAKSSQIITSRVVNRRNERLGTDTTFQLNRRLSATYPVTVDRVSGNQGAESTLAFLLLLAEMRLTQNGRTSFKEPIAVAEEYLRPVLVFLEQSNYVNTT